MNRIKTWLKNEDANAMVENVIILPVILIIIYALIMTCFIVHDRGTIEAAAKRGAIYAAHCVSDPKYAKILSNSGSKKGVLDTDINISDGKSQFSFSGVNKDVQPYRYLTSSSMNISDKVVAEVNGIVNNTRIPWRKLKVDGVQFTSVNKVFYQDVTVTVKHPTTRSAT